MSTALPALAEFQPGTVWLVGAGPGDPGLLTLLALRALQAADHVLHDALVSPEILALAEGARVESVGKRAGRAGASQLRINQRLIALARAGRRVVRLKGGDPLVFGRGGEEALALAAAGVGVRIVPGITAGLGAAASFGIPLTHRGLARAVTFLTGHDLHGALPADLDLAALARGGGVLVAYMARHQAAALAGALIAAGRAPDEAVALIQDATTARQKLCLATLATLASVAAGLAADAPTLIMIGPVLALQPLLAPVLCGAPAASAEPVFLPHAPPTRIAGARP